MGYVLNAKDSYTMGPTAYGLRWDGTHLFACAAGTAIDEIVKLSVNSSTGVMTKVAGENVGASRQVLTDDGIYLYNSATAQLQARNKTTLAILGMYNTGSTINTIVCDASGYIYVGCENGHIYIFTFDGSSFTLRHDEDVGHEVFRLIFDGLNIIGGYDDNHIRAYVWNGSTFTFVDDEDLSGDVSGLYWDGVNLYSAGGWSNRLRAHPWDQSSFGTLIDEIDFDGGSWAVNIVGDGQYVYSAEPGTRLGVYQLSGSTLSLVSSIIDTDIPYQYHTLCFGGGFVFWCSGNYVKSARMDLTAGFTVDKTSGAAGSTFTFTGVA